MPALAVLGSILLVFTRRVTCGALSPRLLLGTGTRRRPMQPSPSPASVAARCRPPPLSLFSFLSVLLTRQEDCWAATVQNLSVWCKEGSECAAFSLQQRSLLKAGQSSCMHALFACTCPPRQAMHLILKQRYAQSAGAVRPRTVMRAVRFARGGLATQLS